VDLPKDQLEVVLAALDTVAKSLPEDPTRSIFATGADALVRMAETVLRGTVGGEAPEAPEAKGTTEVIVHVEARALAGQGGASDLPLPVIRRLTCDGAVVPLVEDAAGQTLEVGRRRRTVSTPLRRALFARDGHCTFPGCHHARFLDAHHIHHWADGGDTNLGNLLTLCSTHHALVHEGGFSIQRNAEGAYYFVRPDGRPLDQTQVPNRVRVEEERAIYRVEIHSAEWLQDTRRPAISLVRESTRESAPALH
jgi:hypothetical protein